MRNMWCVLYNILITLLLKKSNQQMNEQIDDLIKINNPNNAYQSLLKTTVWQLKQKKRLYHFN